MSEVVLVLDFGGQYKELIARSVRGFSVYSEIHGGDISAEEIKRLSPIGIILTGGPNSIYAENAPKCDREIFSLGIPVLGICYGMQLMCHMLGGEVRRGERGEYGRVLVTPCDGAPFYALMSHTDIVAVLPQGFITTAETENCIAACENISEKFYGLQFHPESEHTDGGSEFIRKFLFDVCGAKGDYKLDDYLQKQIHSLREKIGGKNILLGLSGGVDSSVCAALLMKAVPNQLVCIFVDHGFMRQNEAAEIESAFANQDSVLYSVNAAERFLSKIKNVTDPEEKRKIIGEEFIRVFEESAKNLGEISFLAQGTIYPDIVESGGPHGATIKSHHNVGGLPENLSFAEIIEPLSGLFKDEVRSLGKKLGLPDSIINRQPFPGPGLAIRIMGEVTEEKLNILRASDAILREELDDFGLNQYFTVLTNTYSVGVKGDYRTYDPVIAIRAVTTSDFMTCEYAPLPHEILSKISSRLTNEIPSVSRVVYDITSKPPATVEWE